MCPMITQVPESALIPFKQPIWVFPFDVFSMIVVFFGTEKQDKKLLSFSMTTARKNQTNNNIEAFIKNRVFKFVMFLISQ